MTQLLTAQVNLPLVVREISDGILVITCPIAKGIWIGCRSLKEGLEVLQPAIDDLSKRQCEIDEERAQRKASDVSEPVNPSPTALSEGER